MTLRGSVGLGHTRHALPEQLLTAAGWGTLRLGHRSAVQNTEIGGQALVLPLQFLPDVFILLS